MEHDASLKSCPLSGGHNFRAYLSQRVVVYFDGKKQISEFSRKVTGRLARRIPAKKTPFYTAQYLLWRLRYPRLASE